MFIRPHPRSWLHWTARLAGGLSLVFGGLVLLGDGPSGPVDGERHLSLALLLFAALAYLAAWWREIEGGTALATTAVALGGVVFSGIEPDSFATSLAVSLPLFLAGGLFVLSGWRSLGDSQTAG
jgi:hypothetical protein